MASFIDSMWRGIPLVEAIASICHEANRAYCNSIGDSSQPLWDDAPEWQKSSAINGVKFHLKTLEHGHVPDPSSSHENWLREKTEQGWSYGEVKDVEKKTHPCFVPYDSLPIEQQMKDYIFSGIVKSFYQLLHKTKI